MPLPPETQQDLLRRMRRIEGQTQGIQRMLAEGRDCREVLNQLASIRAATRSVSVELAKHYAQACLDDAVCRDPDSRETIIDFLLHLPV